MEFKAYLNQKYQGYDSFIENIIYPIFGEDRYETAYNIEMLQQNPELTGLAERTGISSVIYCGIIELEDNPVYLFDITVKDKVMMERNRVAVQTLVKRVMDTYSGAFMLIHYEQTDKWDWRFTFCQLKDKGEYTDSKRYTFLLGPNQACTTAAQNFGKLAAKGGVIEIADIVKAFDVEALSNEFFGKYKDHYEAFVEYITGKHYEGKEEKVVHAPHLLFAKVFGSDDKLVRDYVKLLLARITFLHFVQKKGWLGVPEHGAWGTGDEQFMLNLFEKASPALKDDFVVSVLNPMFFGALDTDRTGTGDVFNSKVFGRIRVPYLNGGMFEKHPIDDRKVAWPMEYFRNLLKFFSEYNFTIDENDPNEAQVGVDPEMLGKIFENLLEDNKDKGAFYTPKTIVKYMCQESLIAYLVTKTGYDEKLIRDFVYSPEEGKAAFNEDQQYAILDAILKVKICDPAIGSGAFPIGLLNELVWCKEAIYGDKKGRAEIKREIIRDNIYGVDIEKGAVDIARLRFWLSLVVDEEEPSPLPNLDYKIMQGNSLLEWYNGVDLTELVSKNGQDLMLNNEHADKLKKKLSKLLKDYFGESDHEQKTILKQEISSKIKELLGNAAIVIPEDLDVAENNKFFLWHTWFSDVFANNGGFDICIGNPPYINIANLGDDFTRKAYQKLFITVKNKSDLYSIFTERAYHLVKSKGLCCYIFSNSWMGTDSFSLFRHFLVNNTRIISLVDLPDKVFKNATVKTCIILFSKQATNDHAIKLYEYDGHSFMVHKEKELLDYEEIKKYEHCPFIFDNNICLDRVKHVLLGDISTFTLGIKTSNDKRFISSHPFKEDSYKLVTGKRIKRFKQPISDKWIWYRPDLFIEKAGAGPRKLEYFLTPEKILIQDIAQEICATLDVEQHLCNDTVNVIYQLKEGYSFRYILGILNSKAVRFWQKRLFPEGLHVKKYQLEVIPIPVVSAEMESSISSVVEAIIQANNENFVNDAVCLEKQLDEMIYNIYSLSDSEIKLIEEQS